MDSFLKHTNQWKLQTLQKKKDWVLIEQEFFFNPKFEHYLWDHLNIYW